MRKAFYPRLAAQNCIKNGKFYFPYLLTVIFSSAAFYIVLADEPTGALDSRSSENLLELFGEINKGGQTILMVTHSVKAASHAGRVLFLRDGRVYHQLYRGSESREAQFRRISDTLTVLTQGGENHG